MFLSDSYKTFPVRSRIIFRATIHLLFLALRHYKNVGMAVKALKMTFAFRAKVNSHKYLPKCYHANGKYFMSPNIPGFPSAAFDTFFRNQFNILLPLKTHKNHLQLAVFAISSRCPLHCIHCYEAERITSTERLSLQELIEIQNILENHGISQIHYTGGEPLARIDDLAELLKAKSKNTECWLFTSGFHLTAENARKLREAGLCGVFVSLDHWQPEFHNRFRGSDHAFEWAMDAARNVADAGMALCLSVCPARDFITRDNLMKYLQLAHTLKAGFIQILEPRETGTYRGSHAELTDEEEGILEDFMLEVNNNPRYRKWPTVIFPGYYHRKTGCLGAGNQFFYIDAAGDAHACPFCQDSAGNCLHVPLDEILSLLTTRDCPRFGAVSGKKTQGINQHPVPVAEKAGPDVQEYVIHDNHSDQQIS